MVKFNLYISLNDIWCRSPPNIINSSFNTIEVWPSLAHGFFPTIKFELLVKGYKNLDAVYFPNYVIFPSWLAFFGSGSPITSKEFLIAWDSAYNITYLFD